MMAVNATLYLNSFSHSPISSYSLFISFVPSKMAVIHLYKCNKKRSLCTVESTDTRWKTTKESNFTGNKRKRGHIICSTVNQMNKTKHKTKQIFYYILSLLFHIRGSWSTNGKKWRIFAFNEIEIMKWQKQIFEKDLHRLCPMTLGHVTKIKRIAADEGWANGFFLLFSARNN